MPPLAQIEIQQQVASVAAPTQVVPELDVTSEELVETAPVQELEVAELPEPEKVVESVFPAERLTPSPSDVMRLATTDRVLPKPAEPKPLEPEQAEPEVAKPAAQPQAASVSQEYVEAQRSDNKPPPYPKKERRLSIEGQVTVRVTIDVKGSVKGVNVIEWSRYDGFNRAAVEAARKWKFTPATRGGVPVESQTDIEVVFRLTDPE